MQKVLPVRFSPALKWAGFRSFWLLIIFLFLASSSKIIAQSPTWRVVSYGDYLHADMDKALQTAKLDGYRKQTIREILVFENGAKVELFSAEELIAAMKPVDLAQVKPNDFVYKGERIFSVHPMGIILEKSIPPGNPSAPKSISK